MTQCIQGKILINSNQLSTDNILVLNDYWFHNIKKLEKTKPCAVLSSFNYAFSHIPSYLQMLGIPLIFLCDNKLQKLYENQIIFVDLTTNSISNKFEISNLTEANYKNLELNNIKFYASIKGKILNQNIINQSDGIGLISTEFLFYQAKKVTETKQYKLLNDIFSQNPNFEYTVRLFDLNYDKTPTWIKKSDYKKLFKSRGTQLLFNPKLESILRFQLRTLIKLSKKFKVAILIPYSKGLNEVIAIKQIINQLDSQCNMRIGAMIETIEVIYEITKMNQFVDFYSVGTNDLVQSFFGIDRTVPIDINEVDLENPMFWAYLKKILSFADDKDVRICGQLPIIPNMLTKLLDAGYKKFTVNPYWINYLKYFANNYFC